MQSEDGKCSRLCMYWPLWVWQIWKWGMPERCLSFTFYVSISWRTFTFQVLYPVRGVSYFVHEDAIWFHWCRRYRKRAIVMLKLPVMFLYRSRFFSFLLLRSYSSLLLCYFLCLHVIHYRQEIMRKKLDEDGWEGRAWKDRGAVRKWA